VARRRITVCLAGSRVQGRAFEPFLALQPVHGTDDLSVS
jgi:hypothetical protein